MEEPFQFFRGAGPQPETLQRLEQCLQTAGLPHIFIGAIAVNAHGHPRMTRDVEICMRREDLARFRREFVGREYDAVARHARRFVDKETGVTIDILVSGELAGNIDRQQMVRFPDPSEAELRDNLPMISLARLIELKLVTWRLIDWADVIELIRVNALDESFAAHVHPVAQSAYRECFDQMREEDRCNARHEPELDE